MCRHWADVPGVCNSKYRNDVQIFREKGLILPTQAKDSYSKTVREYVKTVRENVKTGMDPPSDRRGAVSLGPELREWFGWIHGNISAAGGPPPLPPPAPPPPKPPQPDCSLRWDDAVRISLSAFLEKRLCCVACTFVDAPKYEQLLQASDESEGNEYVARVCILSVVRPPRTAAT